MNPQEKEQFKREVINEVMSVLGRYDRIPLEVQQALARRFKLDSVPAIQTGNKLATSENQAVDEAGVATYNVLGPPDRFRLLTSSDGTVIGYIPIYD